MHFSNFGSFSLQTWIVEAALAADKIVAVGLLTAKDLNVLGPTFDRVWPVDETPCFADLLQAIDEADRGVWRERDRVGSGLR